MSDPYSILCKSCADDADEDYEFRGRFRNSPGRRTSRECENCGAQLGDIYRPVGVQDAQ